MLRFMRSGSKRTKTIWWVLTVVTVVTFLGGFVFILGSGLDATNRARASGAVGTVNGSSITRTEWQNALTEQREGYRRKYGTEPGDRDMKVVELQTWRSIVMQHLLDEKAKRLGLEAHDHEVVVALQTNPPQAVMLEPAFQTDGKFDVKKYRSALMDTRNVAVVAGLEQMTRDQLPMRKLQERLVASVKLTEPEIQQAYRDRFEKVSATVVQIPPLMSGKPPVASDADLQRIYEHYKDRFTFGPRSQLEVLLVPKKYSDEETKSAQTMAQTLAHRARSGESFFSLAREFSEGPNADKGGIVDRVLQPQDFGQDIAPKIATLDTGMVTDPMRDRGRFLVFKLLQKNATDPQTGTVGVKVSQIVIKIRTNPEALHDQFEDLVKTRNQATKIGLGKAAAAHGMATVSTGPYDASATPPMLYGVPEAADWGLMSKTGAVSPVFEGVDEFAVGQVSSTAPAGPAPRDEITDQLRQIAALDQGVQMNKPRADQVAQALAQGKTLEQAAAAAGLTPYKVEGVTRAQPDPRLGGALEVVGTLFSPGAVPGRVIGPIHPLNGWYFVRIDQRTPADMTLFEQLKGQISNELLRSRQEAFMNGYLGRLRTQAKIEDLRSAFAAY
jgi:parvulin-like peptidyl-prolyl isomerase